LNDKYFIHFAGEEHGHIIGLVSEYQPTTLDQSDQNELELDIRSLEPYTIRKLETFVASCLNMKMSKKRPTGKAFNNMHANNGKIPYSAEYCAKYRIFRLRDFFNFFFGVNFLIKLTFKMNSPLYFGIYMNYLYLT